MALFDQSSPYSGQLTNIAGAIQGPSFGALQTGATGLQNLAPVLQNLGQEFTGAGFTGAGEVENVLGARGALPGLLTSGIQTEQTGLLPPGGQAAVQQNTQDTISNIRGKYAALGMSGSTAEQSEIDRANQQAIVNQFNLSGQLGGQEVNQAVQGLTTAGNLSTTLAQLGFQGYSLSGNDLAQLANTGLQGMQLDAGIYQNLAQSQMAEDSALTNAIGGFFKSIAGGGGLFGNQGLISGVQNFAGGLTTA